MFSQTKTVQLEYINHSLLCFKNISHYVGIMLNAFSDLLCSKLICWHNRLVPTPIYKKENKYEPKNKLTLVYYQQNNNGPYFMQPNNESP